MPYSWQSSIGFQKQLGAVMGFDADLTYLDERNQVRGRDPNLFYDPVTGYNLDPARFGRPNPAYGQMQWMESTGAHRDAAAVVVVHAPVPRTTSRAGVTYTRTLRRNDNTTGFGIQANNQFDLDGDWSRSHGLPARHVPRQRHRQPAVADDASAGSYLLRLGHLLQRARCSGGPFGKPGTNRLNIGAPITIPAAVLDRWEGPAVIATGTAWPRNALRGLPLHKVDMRLSKTHRQGRTASASTLLAEVFNVFNWKNYGNYNTQLDSASFGQPVASSGNAYVPRSGQLGFRLEF